MSRVGILLGWLVAANAFALYVFAGDIRRWWRGLPVGTKSVLVGAHQFILHPFMVALAWRRLYGWRLVTCSSTGVTTSLRDWRLWICFIIHDLGYIGCRTMDGEDGERHPIWAARRMKRIIARTRSGVSWCWHDFVLLHSRFMARQERRDPSLFCHADKAAIGVTPTWLYVPMARLSGEIREYRSRETRPETSKGWNQDASLALTDWQWYDRVRAWALAYAEEHRDGRPDTWTPPATGRRA
jgi:hypothetical protein